MFNLLKVMEICLHENEGNAALTYEGLLEQIRAKISHYITLMVEGSNICDIGHRDWAPVPLLTSRWDRWLARRQTVVLPGNNWQTAACHLCWARTHKGQQRY